MNTLLLAIFKFCTTTNFSNSRIRCGTNNMVLQSCDFLTFSDSTRDENWSG